MDLTCPRCHRDFVQRVQPANLFEHLGAIIAIAPFRCQLCTFRFHAFQSGSEAGRQPVDRRQFIRFAVRIPVTFTGEVRGEGTITDLSMGGCAMEADVKLLTGKVLHLRLKPMEDQPTIGVEGAVVRSVRGTISGLEFLRIAPGDSDRLSKFIGGLLLARKTGKP